MCRDIAGGSNNQATVDALEAMVQALQGHKNQTDDESRGLE